MLVQHLCGTKCVCLFTAMRTQKENIPPAAKGLFLHKILEYRAQLQLCWHQALWFFAVHKRMSETTGIIINMSQWFKNINITRTTFASPGFVYTGKEIYPSEYIFFSVDKYKMGSFSSMGPLVRNTFHQINITIWKDFKPIVKMEVICKRYKASGELAHPKTVSCCWLTG